MLRRQMAERHEREDALVDAALARDDRERPLRIGTNWKRPTEILAGGENSKAAEYFFLGTPRFGEDVGYGPAGFMIRAMSPRLTSSFGHPSGLVPPLRPATRKACWLQTAGISPRSCRLHSLRSGSFRPLGFNILDAATARAGRLIWMSQSAGAVEERAPFAAEANSFMASGTRGRLTASSEGRGSAFGPSMVVAPARGGESKQGMRDGLLAKWVLSGGSSVGWQDGLPNMRW